MSELHWYIDIRQAFVNFAIVLGGGKHRGANQRGGMYHLGPRKKNGEHGNGKKQNERKEPWAKEFMGKHQKMCFGFSYGKFGKDGKHVRQAMF